MANKKEERLSARDIEMRVAGAQSESEQQQLIIRQLTQKIQALQSIFDAAGQIKAHRYYRAQAKFLIAVKFKKIKESEEYWEKYGIPWQEFCQYCGYSYKTIDRYIDQLEGIGDDLLDNLSTVDGVELNKIKYLRKDLVDNVSTFRDGALYFGDQKISLDELPAFLDSREEFYKDRLIDQKKQSNKDIKDINEQLSETEKDKLLYKKEVERLSAFEPKDIDEDIIKRLTAADEALERVDDLLRLVAIAPDELADDTFARVAGILKRAKDRLELFENEFYQLKEVD